MKLKTSASFRAIHLIFEIIFLNFNIDSKAPSHTTIINWVKKIGYHELIHKVKQTNDWVVIIDDSIKFGKKKILLILGIRADEIDFTRPLRFKDLTTLHLSAEEGVTGDLIQEKLDSVKQEVGVIDFAVSDMAGSIRKGLRQSLLIHVPDITHKIATFLENTYKESPEFKKYTKAMHRMRITKSMSSVAHVVPPKQRVKSRYLNLHIISDWGIKVLNYLNKTKKKDQIKELRWVLKHKDFITELNELNQIIKQIEKTIKTEYLSDETIVKCEKIIASNLTNYPKVIEICNQIIDYLKTTRALLPEMEKILCASDIIESAFGKYKNYISKNPMHGASGLALCIAAFTGELTDEMIKASMETSKIKDIKQWTIKNIGESELSKRKKTLNKVPENVLKK